jgi:2-polyprenyl-3-methyl-5-hydroxy-6-metoxy-1,4-benzoquinol methylase
MRCRFCGLRRLWPYLSESELDELYGNAYFEAMAPPTSLAGVDNPGVNYQQSCVPSRVEKFRRIIQRLRALRPDGRTFLDFGAATGTVVALAAEEGLDADGVELSAHAIAVAVREYGVRLRQGGAEAVPDRAYDFIHMHHVFEHLTRPLEDLRTMRQHLAPDGVMFIEIPFQFHAIEKLRFRLAKKASLRSPTLLSYHHPYFYTPESVRRVLERAGFEVMSLRCFVPDDYPADTMGQKFRKVVWAFLDRSVSIGNIMEIVVRNG